MFVSVFVITFVFVILNVSSTSLDGNLIQLACFVILQGWYLLGEYHRRIANN